MRSEGGGAGVEVKGGDEVDEGDDDEVDGPPDDDDDVGETVAPGVVVVVLTLCWVEDGGVVVDGVEVVVESARGSPNARRFT